MDDKNTELQVKPESNPALNALDVSGIPGTRGTSVVAVDAKKGQNETTKEVERGNLPAVDVVGAEAKPAEQKPAEAKPENTDRSEKKVESNPRVELSKAERERVSYHQENLIRLLPKIWKVEPGRDVEKNRELAKKDLEELTRKIKAEQEAGQFGPATQKAYQRFLDWYQKEAVPATVITFDKMGLQMPPGCPCDLPLNENGRPIQPQLFKNMVALDDVKFNAGLDATKIPNDTQLDAMEKGLDWLENANRLHENAMLKRQEEVLSQKIKEEGLPEGWMRKPGEDLKSWVASSAEMVDLASRNRNYIEAMHSMYKASTKGDFPFKLPTGSSITIEIDGKEQTVVAGEEHLHQSVLRNAKGNVTRVNLELPQDLRQEHPANSAKIERMRQWLDSDQCTQIEKALTEYLKIQQRPESVIMYGDQPIPDGHGRDLQGRFGPDGGLLGIVDANEYKAKNGESVKDLNLLGYDFDVTKTDDGKIIVDQTIQGWDMPWYAYQDIRAFGDKVGKPMSFTKPVPENFANDYAKFEISVKGEKRTLYRHKDDASDVVELMDDANPANRKLKQVKIYEPNDFVPVRDGANMRIMKAKDLSGFLSNEKAFYYGSKGLMIALDAAMLVTGTIELAAVTKGAQLAATTGIRLAGREAAIQGTKAASRIVVGGAGLFSNSGAMNTEWGRNINTARGIYFIADIGHGLLRGGVNLARGAKAAETLNAAQAVRPLSGAQKVHSIINGTKAADSAKALEGMGWVSSAHKAANVTFRVTEVGFAPIVGRDLLRQIKQVDEQGARNPLEDALVQVGDGRGLQKADGKAFDTKNVRALEAAREVMDGYIDNLTDGRTPDAAKHVKDILTETKRLLGPEVGDAERKAFKDKLISNVSFSPDEIRELEQIRKPTLGAGSKDQDYYNDIQLSAQEIQKLLDKEARLDVKPPELQRRATEILARKDRDVATASIIALTYLSREANGSVSKNIASVEQTVPKYETSVLEEYVDAEASTSTSTRKITVEPRTINVDLSAQDGMKILKQDLEGNKAGSRGIAAGDLLVRTGNITHRQYAGVLQDVLQDPNSTPQDKMRAMVDATGARFASIVDGVRHEDEAARSADSRSDSLRGKNFGLSSDDLIKTLEKVAGNPAEKSRDVRAMATAILYGLSERHVERRTEILQAVTGRWLAQGVKHDGTFSNEVVELLKREMGASIPEDSQSPDLIRETKLNAALALVQLAPASDHDLERKINESIARSMSTTDSALAVRTLDALTPERIKQLETDNPLLIQSVRNSAISLIKLPRSLEEEDAVVKILSKMDKLFLVEKDKTTFEPSKVEQLRKLDGKLKELLNPESKDASDNSAYAKYYPHLRVTAIEMLSTMGSQDARDVIRYHLAPGGTMKFGNRTIEGQEPDARVRMAAVKGLQKLNDVEFPSVANSLVDSEPDADISRELREVRFLARQIEPGTPKWDDIKQKYAEKESFAEKIRKELGSDFDYETFIGESSPYKMLKAATFTRNANNDAEDTADWYWPFNNDSERNESIGKSVAARRQQWNALVTQAEQQDKDGLQAKAALFKVIDTNANLQGAPGNTIQIGSKIRYNDDYVARAAEAFRELAKPGRGQNDFTRWSIRKLLETGQAKDNPTAMNALVDGWKSLYTAGSITREEYAVTLGTALHLQLDNVIPANKNVEDYRRNLQMKLLTELATVKHRELLPVFDAVANGVVTNAGRGGASRYEEVRSVASRLLSDFQDSVDMLHKQSVPDQTSTSEQRAERVRIALEGKDRDGKQLSQGDTEKTITEMFNAYRGYRFANESDRGLRYLTMALKSDNERIRLAAARIITESNLGPRQSAREQAQQTLMELNAKSPKPRIREDAERDLLKSRRLELGWATPNNIDGLMNSVGWMNNIVAPKDLPNSPKLSPSEVASNLRKSLARDEGRFNHEDSARAILNAVNGSSPIIAADDPRRETLTKTMAHSNERIRLASAWMLAQSAIPADRDSAVKVLATISANSENPGRANEASHLLVDMIDTGDNEDRKRASDAWKVAYASRANKAAQFPLEINERSRMTDYYARAPLTELDYVIKNASNYEKKDIVMKMTGMDAAGVAEWLAPPAKARDFNRPLVIMNAASCHSGNRNQQDTKWQTANDKFEENKARLAHEESLLDDYFRTLMVQGTKYMRTSAVPIWTPQKLGERPSLSGKTVIYKMDDGPLSSFRSGGSGNLFGPGSFKGERMSDQDLQKLLEYMKNQK